MPNNLKRLSKTMISSLPCGYWPCILNGGAFSFLQDIAVMEEELKIKTEIIKKNERLIQGWKKELKDQLDKHNTELEKV